MRQIQLQQRRPSGATVRRLASMAIKASKYGDPQPILMSREAFMTATAPPAAPGTSMADLPYLTRRVLRIIAVEQSINLIDLDRAADLDRAFDCGSPARPHADSLVLYGLVARTEGYYSLTNQGQQCLAHSPVAADQKLAHRLTYLSNV